MRMEVGGDVSDLDLGVRVAFAAPERIGRCGRFVGRPNAGALKLIGRGIRELNVNERVDDVLALAQRLGDRLFVVVEMPPVANAHPIGAEMAARIRDVRIQREPRLDVARGFFVAFEST